MQAHEGAFSVSAMGRALEVTCSGYSAWKRRGDRRRDEENRHLDAEIGRFFGLHKACYGAPDAGVASAGLDGEPQAGG